MGANIRKQSANEGNQTFVLREQLLGSNQLTNVGLRNRSNDPLASNPTALDWSDGKPHIGRRLLTKLSPVTKLPMPVVENGALVQAISPGGVTGWD